MTPDAIPRSAVSNGESSPVKIETRGAENQKKYLSTSAAVYD
jgi:hypothetical protein